MRPNHHLHFQSVLLARTRTYITPKNPASTTCSPARRIQRIKPAVRHSVSSRFYSINQAPKSTPWRLDIRSDATNKKASPTTPRHTSTISSNPPPPSTSDLARRSKSYTPPSPPPSSTPDSGQTPIPDPTTSYSAPVTSLTPPPLTWNTFLSLRRTRRHYNLVASICTSLLTTTSAFPLLSNQPLESMTIFGLDPFIVLGLSTFSCAALGWLLGPTVGNAVFNFVHRARRRELDAKERDFFARIRKNRVDASGSSAGNPVPDYYGEKIGSVAGYRTWLRDQRAFNRRRQRFL